MTDDRDICERLEDTNYDGAFAMRREAAKLIRQLRHYVDRLEDDLREADLKTESLLKHIGRQQLDISMLTGEAREAQNDHLRAEMETDRLREHIAQQQLDIVVLGQEAGRMREALERIVDTDPDEGTEWFHDVARAALWGKRGSDE
jgi:septal ring factor EnvC (AmiA/AmiB activator)